jgi:hypothetical protein
VYFLRQHLREIGISISWCLRPPYQWMDQTIETPCSEMHLLFKKRETSPLA